MRHKLRFLIVSVFLLVASCASFMEYGKLEDRARKNYLEGDFDSSVFTVVKSLKIEPTYDKAQELVKDVFPKAVDAHIEKINQLKDSNEKFKWDGIVSEYTKLIELNKAAGSLPPLTIKKTKEAIKFEIKDYSVDLSTAKTNAAEAHYQEGVLLSKSGTSTRERAAKEFTIANKYVPNYKDAMALAAEGYYKEGLNLIKQHGVDIQKQAAKEFKTAMSFVPDYKDSAALYEKARKAGVKRVAIIPFADKSGKTAKYGAVADTVADQIISKIMNNQGAMEFLEIISREQLGNVMQEQKLGTTGIIDDATAVSLGKVLGVHEIITGKITGITYTPERTTEKNVSQKANVVVGEENYYDNKGKQRTRSVWGDVHANVTIFMRTAGTSVNGSYTIIDVKTAKNIKTNAFTGKDDFKSEWGRFTGDERALDQQNKALCSKNEEMPPAEEELVNTSLKKLSDTLANEIISYAK